MMDKQASAMTSTSSSRFSRLLGAMFPRMPDFHGLLNDQCDLVVRAMDEFVAFMQTGDEVKAREVRRLEHEGDKLKVRNIDVLNRSFSTPFDREDIYRAITAIDEGLNYAKTTVREMEVLGVTPDTHTLEMAQLLHQGAQALQTGFARLKANPLAAERDAAAVRKTERQAEKVYRRAIAELFDAEHYARDLAERRKAPGENLQLFLEPMEQAECSSVVKGISFVMEVLKRREIYRHLSNAADHLAHAGDILHDIVVKTA
ncbi:MAG: hypothetical protein ACI8W7_003309 [Gammaproteobacteria bacterium]|jgi:uncharacterized protein Yka (UPF0111/DUF47 family)